MVRWLVGALLALGALGFVALQVAARTAPRPDTLGVTNGALAPCPPTPNCVTTQRGAPSQLMQPLAYTTAQEQAKARLLEVLRSMDGATVVVDQGEYVAAEFRSRVFGFIDDVEFVFDDANKQIHFRSASRLGRGDMGVNRERMEELTRLMGEL